MFKKLKDKIAEEVKSTPQRIQQFTQPVTDRIQNNSNDENFFSIGGEDDSQNTSTNLEQGFTNVSLTNYSTPINEPLKRKNSASSIASDISFLNRYESPASTFHLQSDVEYSASEFEDNASTASSQIGHLSKEQIYSAFQKAQTRYHKYRGRFTDLTHHYKELEREKVKMQSILVETQDKALRRIAELKEQCTLEQSAKAHLENTLREDLNEKDIVIKTLKDKIQLLQNSTQTNVPLLDLSDDTSSKLSEKPSDIDVLTKDLKEARFEIEKLNEKIQEMKANAIVFQSKESDMKNKISQLEKNLQEKTAEILEISEREKENNIKIAETKLELHAEIQNKDVIIEKYKNELENLKGELDKVKSDKSNAKMDNLHSQNTKLIEKVEMLTEKCNKYESEILKNSQLKIEIDTLKETVKDFENKNKELAKIKSEIETNYEKLKTDSLAKNEKYEFRIREVQDELAKSLTEINALQNTLKEKENEIIEKTATIDRFNKEIAALKEKYESEIETIRGETKASVISLEEKIRNKLNEEYLNKEEKLKADFEEKLQKINSNEHTSKELEIKLIEKEDEVKNLTLKIDSLDENLIKLKENYKQLENGHLELISENTKTQKELSNLQKEKQKLENEIAKKQEDLTRAKNENAEVLTLVKNLEGEIGQREKDALEIKNENSKLLKKISNLNTQLQDHQNENSKLKNEISNMTQKLNDLNNEKQKLDEELAQIKNDLNSKNATLKEKELQVSQLEEKINEKCKEIENVKEFSKQNEDGQQERVASLQQVLGEKETIISLLHAQIEIKEKKLKDVTSEKDEFEDLLNDSSKKIKNFEKRIKALTKENEANKKVTELISKQVTELENKIKDVENENVKLKELNLQLEETKSKLSEQENLIQQNCILKSEVADLKNKLSQSEAAISNLQDAKKENAKLIQENEKFKREHESFEQLSVILEKEKSELQEQIAQLHSQIQEVTSKNNELENSLRNSAKTNKEHKSILNNIKDLEEKYAKSQSEIEELTQRNAKLTLDYNHVYEEYERTLGELEEFKIKASSNENAEVEWKTIQTQLITEIDNITKELTGSKEKISILELELENMRGQTEILQRDLELAKTELQIKANTDDTNKIKNLENEHKSIKHTLKQIEEERDQLAQDNKKLEAQLREMDHHFSEMSHENQLLKDEIQELKISPLNFNNKDKFDNLSILDTERQLNMEHDNYLTDKQKEIDCLQNKLTQYESLEITNRSSIHFYEEELEKLKSKNEKLNRTLDETLVTLNHMSELQNSTELEYLKNVLYNYMLGKESMVLARVIAAVCKFDQHQTEAVLQKEQQKQTLLGSLGIV